MGYIGNRVALGVQRAPYKNAPDWPIRREGIRALMVMLGAQWRGVAVAHAVRSAGNSEDAER